MQSTYSGCLPCSVFSEHFSSVSNPAFNFDIRLENFKKLRTLLNYERFIFTLVLHIPSGIEHPTDLTLSFSKKHISIHFFRKLATITRSNFISLAVI